MFKPVAIAAGFSFSTAHHPAGGRDPDLQILCFDNIEFRCGERAAL